MKKIASLLLAVLMFCTLIPFVAIPAAAEEEAQPTFYEFLDVGAGAYINTGIIPTNATRVVMDMEQNKAPETALFGVAKGWGGYALYSFDNGQLVYFYGDGGTFEAGTMTTGRHTVETDKNAVKIDGVQTYSDTALRNVSVGDHTMYLFAVNTINGSQASAWSGDGQFIRFYSCQIYEGDTLVRDFVPATKVNAEGVLEIGVYDNKEGKFYAKQGNGNMEASYMHAYKYLGEGSELPISWEGIAIDFDGKITVSHDTTIIAPSSTSAIYICPGRNVTIEIKEGVTLNAWGGDAVGTHGAGAGIEVPENSTLNIIGTGTLNVKGGDAAVGENGENGGNSELIGVNFAKGITCRNGAGGRGGNGGGGAGAGIGGRGGNGGLGGTGGARVETGTDAYKSGIAGENGKNGTAGAGCGKVTVSDTVKGKIQGGFSFAAPSQGGICGESDYRQKNSNSLFGDRSWYCTYGGGGGGAGGNGYPGSNIGDGGAGAGGGGGGGSGFITWWSSSRSGTAEETQGTGHGGLGGFGVVNGSVGKDNGPEVHAEDLVAGAGGKGGAAGGGKCSNTETMYLDEASRNSALATMLEVGTGAYFDTGYVPTVNTRVVMDCEVNNQWAALFGTIYFGYGHYYHYYVNSDGTKFGSGFSASQSWAENALVEPGRHTIELDKNAFIYDHVKQMEHNGSELLSWGTPMYLFGIHLDDQPQTFENQQIRFYSCQIYESGKLVRDYIPTKVGNEDVLLDWQNGMIYKNMGGGSIISYHIVSSENGFVSSDKCLFIEYDGKITVSEDTTIQGLPAQSGIHIGNGREVTIEIKKGVTLTVNGGNACGRLGAGAGIEVPEDATLKITGEGTLKVKGGDAAIGENGGNGANGRDDSDLFNSVWLYTSGAGGKGGDGGGGAGAGIGGKGGDGGLGGLGGASVTLNGSASITNKVSINGIAGGNGKNGNAGGGCGKVYIDNTVNAAIQGGTAFDVPLYGGTCGTKYNPASDNFHVFGGGGGGAGGNGYPAAKIGTGGAGGAGGGGGGSGASHYQHRADLECTGRAGLGGAGYDATGGDGAQSGENNTVEGYKPGAGGQGGLAGGGAGVEMNGGSTATGSVLSQGSLTVIVGVAAAVVFGLGGFFLGTKKRKVALASGTEKEDEKIQ